MYFANIEHLLMHKHTHENAYQIAEANSVLD